MLCVGSTLLLVQSKALDEAPNKLSGAVVKLAGITFSSLAFSYWFDKPWFLTERKLVAVLIIPSLGVPNWAVIYINTAPQSSYFLAPLPGRKKKTSARGVLHAHPSLCFLCCYTLFLLASFYQKYKKI
jgi:hypothetical protein